MTLIVLEATGGYEAQVAAALGLVGLPVAVVNPRQVRDFAKAGGKLAKSDTIDALVLAHFGEAMRPEARGLGDEQTREIKQVMVRRRQLQEMLTAERNRLRLSGKVVRPRLEAHIDWLENELKDLDGRLRGNCAPARYGESGRSCTVVCPVWAQFWPPP